MTKIKIVTHNGDFHADDVFGVATLLLVLGEDDVEVIRTRDVELIGSADYVVDVGDEYDAEKNKFDHHQKEGVGERGNGIPYAAFGLVWERFGEQLSGSREAADIIDKKLVQPLDARDNGLDVCEDVHDGVHPYGISDAFYALKPTWKERESGEKNTDEAFMEAAKLAKHFLEREIRIAKDILTGIGFVEDAYEKAEDKRIVVMDKEPALDREVVNAAIIKYKEPLFVVKHRPSQDAWQVSAVRDSEHSYKNRKNLPEEWAGKRDKELIEASGVPNAIFCHKGLFLAIAKSREGALKLAKLAVEA